MSDKSKPGRRTSRRRGSVGGPTGGSGQAARDPSLAEPRLPVDSQEPQRSSAFILALSQVAIQLQTATDVDHVLRSLGEELRALGLTCVIALVHPDDQSLAVRYSSIDAGVLSSGERLLGRVFHGYRLPGRSLHLFQEREALFETDPVEITASLLPGIPKPIVRKMVRLAGVAVNTAVAYLPLRIRDRIMGALAVWGPGLRADSVPALTVFAGQVSAAIDSARLYATEHARATELSRLSMELENELNEKKRQDRLLRALNDASLTMARASTPEEVFPAVAEELRKLGFSSVVFLLDESRSTLSLEHVSYDSQLVVAAETLLGMKAQSFAMAVNATNEAKRVIQDQATIFVENMEELLRATLPSSVRGLAGLAVQALKIRNIIYAPMVVGTRSVGMMGVQSDDLVEADAPAITAFAHGVAAAWHKANLTETLRDSLGDLRKSQDGLVRARKMEAIGRLAGQVAHYNNNLLTVILGYGRLLGDSLAPSDPRHKYLEPIEQATEKLITITRQVLAFSRKRTLDPVLFDLNECITGLRPALERTLGARIYLSTVLDPVLRRARVDARVIREVITELVENAHDAMPQGGRVLIATENVELADRDCAAIPGARPGSFVCLTISDTGVGMKPEVLEQVFEPFFTTKDVGRGTGLSLAAAYGSVTQQGGCISVQSQLGRGSTFKVYLPTAGPDLDASDSAPDPDSAG